jgi:hypothetical protein
MTRKRRSEIARIAGLALQEQRRRTTGAPEPTEYDRQLRRARNQRYFENLRKRQQAQQRAA